MLSHFDKFDAIEIDAVRVSDALRMHASRVLAIVEDIVDNTGNPDKIRKLMQDLGRNHYKQVPYHWCHIIFCSLLCENEDELLNHKMELIYSLIN